MVNFPFGQADFLTVAPAAAMPVAIDNNLTYVRISGNLAANGEITFALNTNVTGAMVVVEASCGANAFNVTFNTSTASGIAIAGAANKTKTATFMLVNGRLIQIAQGSHN